jgi:hypothetical protein
MPGSPFPSAGGAGPIRASCRRLRALGGSPTLPQTQNVPDFDYAAFANLLGLEGTASIGRKTSRPFSTRPYKKP